MKTEFDSSIEVILPGLPISARF